MACAGESNAKESICSFVAPKVARRNRWAARFNPRVPLNSGNGMVRSIQGFNAPQLPYRGGTAVKMHLASLIVTWVLSLLFTNFLLNIDGC
jgi:hypothetical protein